MGFAALANRAEIAQQVHLLRVQEGFIPLAGAGEGNKGGVVERFRHCGFHIIGEVAKFEWLSFINYM